MNDPIKIFESVLQDAKYRHELGTVLSRVRRADESDKDTLERLIRERVHVVKKLREARIRVLDAGGEWSDYWYYFCEAVDALVDKAYDNDRGS